MADINSELLSRHRAPVDESSGRCPAAGPDLRLITFVELLFFAYRDFTREADAALAELGLGRAHHRVLHFVNRHPGLRVADLLEILKITKQSLARVLKQLVDEGWIVQKAGERDRRQRLLHATEKGVALARRLDSLQAKRVAQALAQAGDGSDGVTARFLFNMIAREERPLVEVLLPEPIDAIAASRT
jgi:DNA-binding MarR family transcriptional regulator